jgi:hypothetical protein
MSTSMYESLCSQLENALKRYVTGGVKGSTELYVDLLCDKLVRLYRELETSGHGEAGRGSCGAAILKYNLIPLHLECIDRHASLTKMASSYQIWYFALPRVFAQVVKIYSGNESFLLPLRDCLLRHDYLSFLMSENLAYHTRVGEMYGVWLAPFPIREMFVELYGVWFAAAPICSLVEFILKMEDAGTQQQQQLRASGISGSASTSSIIRGEWLTSFRSPQPTLPNEKLERFLLQCLSLALREALPTDQAPPGALARFSQGKKAGQFLGG